MKKIHIAVKRKYHRRRYRPGFMSTFSFLRFSILARLRRQVVMARNKATSLATVSGVRLRNEEPGTRWGMLIRSMKRITLRRRGIHHVKSH